MDRNPDGTIARVGTLDAEDRADRLALELLAPIKCVWESLALKSAKWNDPKASDLVERLLAIEYGLPGDVARNYARFLVTQHAPAPTFRDWLRGEN